MNIIKSELVGSNYDAFWDDIGPITVNATARPVLVVVGEFDAAGQEETQLQKMLEACKLRPEQYNIVRVKKDQKVAWHQLRDRLDPKIVFLIGVLPVQLGVSALFRLHEPNRFNDRIWLPAISIQELDQFADVKKQLWIGGMKPVFVDKSLVSF